MMNNMLSVIIPTFNRSAFLYRQIRYYCALKFKGTILIGDSSSGDELQRNKQAIKSFNDKLNIHYREFPTLNEPSCNEELIKLIKTPYAVFVADDDFLVPSGLEKCIDFLEKNSKYNAAHGVGIRLKTENSDPHGKIIICTRKRQPVVDEASASYRYLNFMNFLADVHFSVHRVQSFRLMFYNSQLYNNDRVFSSTLQPCCISVIQGKIKELNCLSLVRQINDYRYPILERNEFFGWITNEKWLNHLNIFYNIVVKELMFQDNIKFEESKKVVMMGLSKYIVKRLGNETDEYYANKMIISDNFYTGKIGSERRLEKYIICFKNYIKKIKSFMSLPSDEQNKISLESLLNPSSPYHKDFMPIYRAITEQY